MNTKYWFWLAHDTSVQLIGSIRSFVFPMLVVLALDSYSKAGTLSAICSIIAGLLVLVGGYLVDRKERRTLLISSSITVTIIYFIATIWLYFAGISWTFLVIIACLSAVWFGLFSQASNIYLRNLISGKKLPKALSVNQMRDGVIELSSAPLSGLLLNLGIIFPFLTNFFLGVLSLLTSLALPSQNNHLLSKESGGNEITDAPKGFSAKQNFVTDAFKGIKLILQNSVLRTSTAISALYFPILNGVILMIMMESVGSEKGVLSAALYNSAIAAGAILGSIIATKVVEFFPTGMLIISTLITPVILLSVAIIAENQYLKLFVLIFTLILLPAGNSSFGAYIMLLVPNDFLGRIFSTTQLLSLIFTPCVALFVGFGLEKFGLLFTGFLMIGCMAIVAAIPLITDIRKIPRPSLWSVTGAQQPEKPLPTLADD